MTSVTDNYDIPGGLTLVYQLDSREAVERIAKTLNVFYTASKILADTYYLFIHVEAQ